MVRVGIINIIHMKFINMPNMVTGKGFKFISILPNILEDYLYDLACNLLLDMQSNDSIFPLDYRYKPLDYISSLNLRTQGKCTRNS